MAWKESSKDALGLASPYL